MVIIFMFILTSVNRTLFAMFVSPRQYHAIFHGQFIRYLQLHARSRAVTLHSHRKTQRENRQGGRHRGDRQVRQEERAVSGDYQERRRPAKSNTEARPRN